MRETMMAAAAIATPEKPSEIGKPVHAEAASASNKIKSKASVSAAIPRPLRLPEPVDRAAKAAANKPQPINAAA